jgi:hypothetical protein
VNLVARCALSLCNAGEMLSLTVASSSSLQFIFASKPQKLQSIDLSVPTVCVEADRCPANATSTNLIICECMRIVL